MSFTPWKFVLRAKSAFDVVVNVNNMGPSKVVISEIALTRNTKGEVTNLTATVAGQVFLKRSGRGVIALPFQNNTPDSYYVAHCFVLRAPSPADRWSWALSVEQSGKPCGIIPGPSPTTGQKFDQSGILDPAEGGYDFGGQPSSESTISFDVIAP